MSYRECPLPVREVVDRLIRVGEALDRGEWPVLYPLQGCDAVNRMWRETWDAQAERLATGELIRLIKGLVHVERELRWIGGSVAGAIWLFRRLHERDLPVEVIDEVADWVIRNTRNPYNPFGTAVISGARNYNDFLQRSGERQARIAAELERDEAIRAAARERREALRKARQRSARERNSEERRKLVKVIEGLPVRDQLIMIARDECHRPNFYPTRCADAATTEVILSLPEETRLALANRMVGKYRGPWGAFKKRLMAVCGGIHDRPRWALRCETPRVL